MESTSFWTNAINYAWATSLILHVLGRHLQQSADASCLQLGHRVAHELSSARLENSLNLTGLSSNEATLRRCVDTVLQCVHESW